MKRSKKKYRATIISLVISIVTFIAISAFIDYGFNLSNVYYKELGYNFNIYSSDENAEQNFKIYKDISNFETIDEYSIHRIVNLSFDYNKYLSEFGKKINLGGEPSLVDKMYIPVVSVGEDEYKRYISDIGENYDKCKDAGILINKYIYYGEKKEEGYIYNLNKGDILETELKENKQNIKIASITDKKPMGLEENNCSLGYLIVSDSLMDKLGLGETTLMYIQSNNSDKLAEELEEYMKQHPEFSNTLSFSNYDEYARSNNALVLVISIFLYGFIAVITAIGVTNIFNTITTNMNLRSKEFANLKSIGMTKKEFNRMIRLESIFYGTKSLIIRNTNRYITVIFYI